MCYDDGGSSNFLNRHVMKVVILLYFGEVSQWWLNLNDMTNKPEQIELLFICFTENPYLKGTF